jgi:serine/threonine protein kinase
VLTDFGLAKDFTDTSSENEDERARTLCGTMEYMVRFKEELESFSCRLKLI